MRGNQVFIDGPISSILAQAAGARARLSRVTEWT